MAHQPDQKSFIPASGSRWLTAFYDPVLALVLRERTWKAALVEQIAPQPGQRILDLGCGAGTLAVLVKTGAPAAEVVGFDPDPQVLERARRKAEAAGLAISWRQGFADELDQARAAECGYDKGRPPAGVHERGRLRRGVRNPPVGDGFRQPQLLPRPQARLRCDTVNRQWRQAACCRNGSVVLAPPGPWGAFRLARWRAGQPEDDPVCAAGPHAAEIGEDGFYLSPGHAVAGHQQTHDGFVEQLVKRRLFVADDPPPHDRSPPC
jgi:SAM-dependent methyltransferase